MVPLERMKPGKPLRVPLSAEALAHIVALSRIAGAAGKIKRAAWDNAFVLRLLAAS